jgi:hypothetical protein
MGITQRIAPSGSAKQLGKVGRSGMHVSSSVERLWTGHATNSEGITSNAIQSQKALPRFKWRFPSWRIIVYAAVTDIHPAHDAIPYRRAALDNPPAYGSYVVTGGAVGNADVRLAPADGLIDMVLF